MINSVHSLPTSKGDFYVHWSYTYCWRDYMKLIVTFLESNLLSALIAVAGVWLSHKLAVGKTQRAMESFKSQLTKKIYASSKRYDIEYEIYHKLSKLCGDIYLIMEHFYPDKMSLHQINGPEKPTLKELALKIHELDVELNIHRAFVTESIVAIFENLIKDADQFFVCAEKHIDCWNETKEDIKRKEDLRNIAYEKRLSFYDKWKAASTDARKYLQSKELI